MKTKKTNFTPEVSEDTGTDGLKYQTCQKKTKTDNNTGCRAR